MWPIALLALKETNLVTEIDWTNRGLLWWQLCVQIKKFRDALAKHNPDRCSIGPTRGLEESELLALAANKDLQFTYTKQPEPVLNGGAEVVAPGSPRLPAPAKPLVRQGSGERSLVSSGRWDCDATMVYAIASIDSVQFPDCSWCVQVVPSNGRRVQAW
jgi:hypothetical protein